jgi:two-component system response regulator MprA
LASAGEYAYAAAKGEAAMARILVADDDEEVGDFIDLALTGAGHQVDRARDGGDVLAALAGPAPDLILLDLHMPVLDGLDALRRLRARGVWPETPVLFLTASNMIQDMVEARRLGARGYLTKPIRHPLLVERVRRVLEEPSLLWIDDMTESRSA